VDLAGPCEPEGFEATRLRLLADGPVAVLGVDKFPRMADYVVPTGVRIADADRAGSAPTSARAPP
jgi:2,3,4,5-tetrahydropyridine-2-carboxylate N-succinyltransferase